MRTRFLNIDYFDPVKTTETLNFLHLPIPKLPSSNLPDFEGYRSFDSVFSGPSSDVPTLPIDIALSKFLSDVLPQSSDVASGDFTLTPLQSRKDCYDDQRNFSSESTELRVLEFTLSLQKGKETPVDDMGEHDYAALIFETPQLDQSLGNAFFPEKKEMLILSEVPEVENNLDFLTPLLQMEYPCEVQESVYSVEGIASGYHMDQAYFLEDAGSVQDQNHFHHCTFPLLEECDMSLRILSRESMEDELLLFLQNIEPQYLTPKDDPMVDDKELFGSVDTNILKYFSDHSLKQGFESEMEPNLFLETDFIRIRETPHVQINSACPQETSDGDSFFSVNTVLFEEYQILDIDSSQFSEVLSNLQTLDEPEPCGEMFEEVMNSVIFNDLVVSYELALVDDAFKSLPVPVFSDYENIRSLYAVVDEILAEVRAEPLFASVGIYLDWHLLEDGKCKNDLYTTYQSMLEEVNSYSIDPDLKLIDNGSLVFDLVFAGDIPKGPNAGERKEFLNIISCGISMPNEHQSGFASNKLLGDECLRPGNGDQFTDNNAARVSLLFESMSQFNDLDFFLNPRKPTAGVYSEPAVQTFDAKATFSMAPSNGSTAACASTGVQLPKWDIKFHQVQLSDNLLVLMDNFQKSYLAILENDTELKKTHHMFLVADRFKLLSLPKQELIDCIRKASILRSSLTHGDENIMTFATLCAIKQMAWYLCFYGIHTTYLYVDNLCRSLEFLKYRLSFLHSLIGDARGKADQEITRLHPSLSVIQGILWSSVTQNCSKVLIVAEHVFWGSLKMMLTSMRISFDELGNFHTNVNQPDGFSSNEFSETATDALLHSDCLLASHQHVSASFPFDKFSIIVEYGGSFGASRISVTLPKLVGLPHLHFLKVKLEDFSVSKAFCEGFDTRQHIESTLEGESYSILGLDESMNDRKLEELLNFVPMETKFNVKSLEDADNVKSCSIPYSMPLPVSCAPVDINSKQMQQSVPSLADQIVIVNTQNLDNEMIISRRSTYQRILALEKEGAQVIERDLNLPIDIILSAAMCLVWYDCKNIGNKAITTDEASSCVALCVENIATDVLTMLSFSFSGCVLVFEGEISFITAIMESSDVLYAAAASLGIDFQLFFSYSPESTDEIILNCIENATEFTRGLYPKMPESETLAESFLTKFPSINPLSAHAILSSTDLLVEFFEWSHEHRIRALQKYHVPEESIRLLSSLCRYGEREDSRSGMTDCSSSVSSAPESEYCHFKIDSSRKKQKFIQSPQKIEKTKDGQLKFETLNQVMDDDGLHPSRVSKMYDFQMSKGPESLSDTKGLSSSLKDKLFGQKEGSDKAEVLHEDFIGEVVDLTDSSLLDDDFSSVANSISFSPLFNETKKYPATRNSKIVKKLSFDGSSLPTFPRASEINYDPEVCDSAIDHKQSTREGINGSFDTDFNTLNTPLKTRTELLRKDSIQEPASISRLSFQENDRPHYVGTPLSNRISGPSFQEKDAPHYGGTPLKNAICSVQLPQKSPWTIEFLNGIREKSRLRQKYLKGSTSAPHSGYSRSTTNFTKQKSPSILDFYKYEGGTPSKSVERKRKKQSIQPSSASKYEKTSAPPLFSWTPIDKRARQTLSFAMNGSGNQTKLVWSDRNVPNLYKRYQN